MTEVVICAGCHKAVRAPVQGPDGHRWHGSCLSGHPHKGRLSSMEITVLEKLKLDLEDLLERLKTNA